MLILNFPKVAVASSAPVDSQYKVSGTAVAGDTARVIVPKFLIHFPLNGLPPRFIISGTVWNDSTINADLRIRVGYSPDPSALADLQHGYIRRSGATLARSTNTGSGAVTLVHPGTLDFVAEISGTTTGSTPNGPNVYLMFLLGRVGSNSGNNIVPVPGRVRLIVPDADVVSIGDIQNSYQETNAGGVY